MTVPVIAVALDRFGADVVDGLRGWLSPERMPEIVRAPLEGDPVAPLPPALQEVLFRLTRAGATSRQGGPRVQIAAFVDTAGAGAGAAGRLATALSVILQEGFAAIFDPRSSPDQRNAALHVFVRVPPLGATAATERALRQLAELEGWAPRPGGYPILARIWPLSPQTTAGMLSDRGLVTSAAVWLAAVAASDEVESLDHRFRHPTNPQARVSMFAAGTLSVPEVDVVEYARRRARYDALGRVAARASRPAERTRAETLLGRFPLDDWTKVVQGGAEAAEIRALAAERSGVGSASEEAPIDVRRFDAPATIRQRNHALLAPIRAEEATGLRADVRLSHGLERLTARESEALTRDVEADLDRAFGDQLAPEDGLQSLPEVRSALELLHARIADRSRGGALGTPEEPGPGAVDPDPHRQALEDALVALPSPARRVYAALLAGLAVALIAGTLVLHVQHPDGPPAPATTSGPSEPSPYLPWIVGAVLGLATALGHAYWAAGATVRPIREVLSIRRTALAELRRSGGTGPARGQLEREIDVRARRLRRGIAHAIDLRIRRLGAVITLVNEARDKASRDLSALRLTAAPTAAADDLSPLFDQVEPLHGHLVAHGSLARWVAERRKVVDLDLWTTRLVVETWDPASRDGPCVDDARVLRACDEQVEAVRRVPMLSDPRLAGEAAERTSTFAKNVAHALGPPVKPRSRTGDLMSLREAARVALFPPSDGDRVRDALLRHGPEFKPQEMQTLGARLAMICFWEDLAVENLVHGAGHRLAGT